MPSARLDCHGWKVWCYSMLQSDFSSGKRPDTPEEECHNLRWPPMAGKLWLVVGAVSVVTALDP